MNAIDKPTGQGVDTIIGICKIVGNATNLIYIGIVDCYGTIKLLLAAGQKES